MLARHGATQEKAGWQPGNFSATSSHQIADFGTNRDIQKHFTQLQAAFDKLGHRLTRTTEPDGTTTYFVDCGEFAREVEGIDRAYEFLETIGGTP